MRGLSSPLLDLALSIGAGAGLGLMMLLWAELCGCLSPLNVALYYSTALVFEQLLIFMVTQYPDGFALWVTCAFPLVSLACYRRCVGRVPQGDLPNPTSLRIGFPWKIVLLVSLFSFVQGMVGTYATSHGPSMYLGIFFPAAVVLASVLFGTRRFNFHTVYRWFLPIMAACIVLSIPLQAAGLAGLATFFSIAANRTVVILMFVVLCGMAGTYRVSAILLFGLERFFMLCASLAGRMFGAFSDLAAASTGRVAVLSLFAAILLVVFLYLFYSERYLSSPWGLVFKAAEGELGPTTQEIAALRALGLARVHGLSERETEILLSVIRNRSVKEIGEELLIAQGTVKAHLQHIYRKFDVHSKRELCQLVGTDARAED